MEPAIHARNLCKTFPGGAVAINGLDLAVERGTVYGLIGRNGAGKTTLLRLLAGLLRPDAGEARLLGQNFWTASRETRARVAYLPQSQQFPGWMTFRELSRYLSGFHPRWNQGFVQNAALRWEIGQDRSLGTLSGGEQRKAGLILALASQPEVLLLDEPAGGLDPLSRRELLNALIDFLNDRPGGTILLCSHYITDLERIAERVGIMDRGRLILDRSLDHLQECFRKVQVIFSGDAVPPHFSIPGARQHHISGPVVSGVTEYFDGEHLERLRSWPGVRVQVFALSLEEVFLEIIGLGQPGGASEESEFIQPEKIVAL